MRTIWGLVVFWIKGRKSSCRRPSPPVGGVLYFVSPPLHFEGSSCLSAIKPGSECPSPSVGWEAPLPHFLSTNPSAHLDLSTRLLCYFSGPTSIYSCFLSSLTKLLQSQCPHGQQGMQAWHFHPLQDFRWRYFHHLESP